MSAREESETSPASAHKPRFSLFIATAAGLGYLPKAPGTWGSLAGVALYWLLTRHSDLYLAIVASVENTLGITYVPFPLRLVLTAAICIVVALTGVWTADRAAKFSGKKDPQFVVIDEVSGQFLTYLIALAPANWKYLLLGFILFRVFDIWKPFPARQAESLPGGWGIMADDWIAGFYAAICMWIAGAAGL
jgi:phosphatidylglycerophosphatase A